MTPLFLFLQVNLNTRKDAVIVRLKERAYKDKKIKIVAGITVHTETAASVLVTNDNEFL